MELLVVVLLIITAILSINSVRRKKEFKEESDRQRRERAILEKEKELEAIKSSLKDAEINKLRDSLKKLEEELHDAIRKLDFYKNMEEASDSLNADESKEERNQRIEYVSERIISTKNSSEDTSDAVSELMDAEQAALYKEIESSSNNFFITGKAGTGKSFLLDVFRRTSSKSHIVLAPTGIAALNVSGYTLHSVFGYNNLVNLDIDQISASTVSLKSEKWMVLKKVSVIIIDEISMVRVDTFDKIDKILRVITGVDIPFGGKQMLLFGDLFQLPPVVKTKEYEFLYDRYGGVHFFCSDAYKDGNFKFAELTVNHRQKGDEEFFELLNRIREGVTTERDIETLNSRVEKDTSIYDRYTTLLPKKAEVERLNNWHIDQLETKEYIYEAKLMLNKKTGTAVDPEAIFPIANKLRLKKGVIVMMVSNDPEGRWVNGTLGIVNSLSADRIAVSINRRTYDVSVAEFSEHEPRYVDGKITYEEVLRVLQYPIVPAYAMTIHKSQGQTYQNIVCDIEGCFANGQAYVALSRCSEINGLHLKRPINMSSIRVDKNVVDFYQSQKKALIK